MAAAVSVLTALSLAFAALALLLRLRNVGRDRRQAERLAAWEPAVLEVLAGIAPPEAVQERVDPKDAERFLQFLNGYARRLRGEERETVRALAAPHLPALLPRLEGGAAETRGFAIQLLAGLGLPRYADAVASALDDPSPVVAMLAARGLYQKGHDAHFPAVLARLPRFTLWTRTFLASMLARGGPGSTPLLREMLADGEQPPLARAVAADVLRLLNDLEAVPVAIDVLDQEMHRDLTASCLRLLRQLGHGEHVPIARLWARSPDPVVRSAAVGALGALGSDADISLLREMLDDDAFWVSLEAARGLIAVGASSTLERLAEADGPWSLLASQVLSE